MAANGWMINDPSDCPWQPHFGAPPLLDSPQALLVSEGRLPLARASAEEAIMCWTLFLPEDFLPCHAGVSLRITSRHPVAT